MSQGTLEDEGDEASDQKKESSDTRLENGDRQLEPFGIISNPVASFPSTNENESTSNLTQHVFGDQLWRSSETSRRGRNPRDVVDHKLVQGTSSKYSNLTSIPHDCGSKEEDEGGGDVVDYSITQLIGKFDYLKYECSRNLAISIHSDTEEMEVERTVAEVTEEMLHKIEHEKWEHVNGIYDCNGVWKEWQETVVESQGVFQDDPLVILPYVNLSW